MGGRYWWSRTCPAPTVRLVALSKSLPTPTTHDLSRVVVSVAVGVPLAELADAIAPIATDPFVNVMSTLLNVTTVRADETGWFSVAVTVTLVSRAGEKARQISDV